MVACWLAGWCSVCTCITDVSLVATAQLSVQGDDFSPDLGLGTGMVFTEDETYEDLPKRPRTRGVVMYDRIDLSRFFPPPGNQSAQGSCGSWAVGYGVRSYYLAADANAPLTAEEAVSPSFIFNLTTPGAVGESTYCRGTTFPQTLNLLKDTGAVTLEEWPYDPKTCYPEPPDVLRKVAQQNRIPDYSAFNKEELGDTRRFKEVLANGHPIIVAMKIVAKDYMSYRGGVYKSEDISGEDVTGHGMVVAGFDDDLQAFLLYNSWGERWGDKGRMWIDYETFHKHVIEAYVIDGLTPPSAIFASSISLVTPPPAFAPPPAAPLPLEPDTGEANESVEPPVPEPTPLTPEEKRDAFVTLSEEIRCGRADVEFDESGLLSLSGFAGPSERDAIVQTAFSIDPTATVSLREMAWPACEAAKLLPEDTVDSNLAVLIGRLDEEQKNDVDQVVKLHDGDRFSIAVAATSGPSYLQVFYLQADQSAKEIFRGEAIKGESGVFGVSVGDVISGLRASRPYGPEAVIAFASDGPVIDGQRGMNVAEHDFLTKLSGALDGVASGNRPIVSRIAMVQVMGAELDAIENGWLITAEEAEIFRSLQGADPPDFASMPVKEIVEPGSFPVTLLQHDNNLVFELGDNTFSNVTFAYRSPIGLIDITSRLESVVQWNGSSMTIPEYNLPEGAHRFRLDVENEDGRSTAVEFTLAQ